MESKIKIAIENAKANGKKINTNLEAVRVKGIGIINLSKHKKRKNGRIQ